MIDFLITNKNYIGNLKNQIKLNNNFYIFCNKTPDTLIRGKNTYFFFGKINGYSNKGNFFNIKNFKLKKNIHLFLNKKNIFDGNYLFLRVNNDRIDFNIDNEVDIGSKLLNYELGEYVTKVTIYKPTGDIISFY